MVPQILNMHQFYHCDVDSAQAIMEKISGCRKGLPMSKESVRAFLREKQILAEDIDLHKV